MSDTAAILGNANWLPHRVDRGANVVTLLHVPRDVHRSVTFLDDQYLKQRAAASVPISELAIASRQDGLHFVFHSAFCCSTLLTRALDMPGVAMGLKEPAILNDLAALQRSERDCTRLLGPMLALLGRPMSTGEAIVVKPSNVANILIEPILALQPTARALLLYAPIRSFLISVAKKKMWGRIWTRRLYRTIQRNPAFEPGFSADDLFEQSDLQIAALGWLQQQAQLAETLRRHERRIRTLDSETLLAQRAEALNATVIHFGLPADRAAAAVRAGDDVFAEHSKRLGERYDVNARRTEAMAIEAAHGEEIDMVVGWITAIARQFGVPLTLDQSLV
jgi:hypothetical protein